ncbi:MAG: serine acetyltransferase [Acidobacteria bacterium]|nr:serine acetyltransferase [Acidobacteriota bacterium]
MNDSRLREAISRVVAGAESRTLLSAVDAPPRPRSSELVEILRMLQEVVYPGFYGDAPLIRANLGDRLAYVLHQVHEKLSNQIEKALMPDDPSGAAARAPELATGLLETLPAIADMVADDVRAAFDGDPAATGFDEIILAYPGIMAIFTYRVAHALHEAGVPLVPRMLTEFAHLETGIDIHPGARIGRSFFIDHGTGIVIGETTDIGHSVKLYQGVTLGALSFPKNERGELIRGTKRHPTVEDEVVIYAGATILGGKTVVGRGSVIGGSVWLTASVPPGTRVTLQGDQLKREPRIAAVAPVRR